MGRPTTPGHSFASIRTTGNLRLVTPWKLRSPVPLYERVGRGTGGAHSGDMPLAVPYLLQRRRYPEAATETTARVSVAGEAVDGTGTDWVGLAFAEDDPAAVVGHHDRTEDDGERLLRRRLHGKDRHTDRVGSAPNRGNPPKRPIRDTNKQLRRSTT